MQPLPSWVVASLANLSAALVASASVQARDPLWGDPWEEAPEVNPYSLIQEGFEVVDTEFHPNGREYLYLRQEGTLYRCFRPKVQGEYRSLCWVLTQPEKG